MSVEVCKIERRGELHRLRIACAYPAETIAEGASIACSGPCLTAVAIGEAVIAPGSRSMSARRRLARTTARTWQAGTRLNLERSLKIGDELGGHIVTGHVDGVAKIARDRCL